MRSHRTILLALALFSFATAAYAARGREVGPIILCYHDVGEGSGLHTISRDTFTRQMRFLKEGGYSVITLASLYDMLERGVELPENAVVVTVDDGWRSTMTEVLPIMKRFGFPFTAFIYPRYVSGEGSSLSWNEIRQLVDEGVDVQSHTYSHSFLTRRRQSSKSSSAYSAWLWRELAGSREEIEKHIGRPVRFLAYPYGDYDSRVAAAAAAAGYAAAVTCNHGPIVPGADAYRLRRYAIDRTTTFTQFRSYIRAAGDGDLKRRLRLAEIPEAERIAAAAAKKQAPAPPRPAVTSTAFAETGGESTRWEEMNGGRGTLMRRYRDDVAAILRTRRDLDGLPEEEDES